MLYWLLKFVFVGPFITLYNRPTVEGLEHIPDDGPAIIAGNHLSIADWLFTPLLVPRRITYLAKSEYFTTPGFQGMLQRWFYSATGQVPIDRSGANAADNALITATRLLEDGSWSGCTRRAPLPDGRLYKGKTGMARIALKTRVPVIPVAVIGTDIVSPSLGRVRVAPAQGRREDRQADRLLPLRRDGRQPVRRARRHRRGDVRADARCRGQEYVDVYAASKMKKGSSATTLRTRGRRPVAGDEGELSSGPHQRGFGAGRGRLTQHREDDERREPPPDVRRRQHLVGQRPAQAAGAPGRENQCGAKWTSPRRARPRRRAGCFAAATRGHRASAGSAPPTPSGATRRRARSATRPSR